MQRWKIIILMGVIMSNIVLADDIELFTPLMGDSELYVIEKPGDIEFMNYFFRIEDEDQDEDEQVVGGGGSGGYIEQYGGRILLSTPYYDVIIDGVLPRYQQGDIVTANITIINKGDIPDRDANLTYYLLNPKVLKFRPSLRLHQQLSLSLISFP